MSQPSVFRTLQVSLWKVSVLDAMASFRGKPTANAEARIIMDASYLLSHQSWYPCRLLGQTMFTLNSKNELIFSPWGLATLIGIMKFLPILLSSWFVLWDETLLELFHFIFGKVTRLTYFCQNGQLINAVVADLICLLVVFLKRKEITLFHREVADFLVEINGGDTEFKRVTVEMLQQIRKQIRNHQILIFAAFSYQLLECVLLLFHFCLNPPPNVDVYLWRWQVLTVPPMTALWSVIVILRLIATLPLVGVFGQLMTCANIIKCGLIKEITKAGGGHKISLFQCLERYWKLEKLVSKLNGIFGIYVAVDLLYLIIANAILLFNLGVHFGWCRWLAALNSCILLITHIEVTWVICISTYQLEKGAGEIITIIKEFLEVAGRSEDHHTRVSNLSYHINIFTFLAPRACCKI